MTDQTPPPPPPPDSSPAPPPGWYPTTPGMQGYWDGTQWTGNVAPLGGLQQNEEKTWAVLMHLSVFVASFIGPLVVYLMKKDESPFLRAHAAAALNLQIALFIGVIIGLVTLLIIVGFFILLALVVVGLVYPIMGAAAAGRGDYPTFFGVPAIVS